MNDEFATWFQVFKELRDNSIGMLELLNPLEWEELYIYNWTKLTYHLCAGGGDYSVWTGPVDT